MIDINLGPGLDGPQAAQAILQDHDIPIVFLSSHTEPEVVEKTAQATFYSYVMKNSGITVLDASIKMALQLHAARQALQLSNERLRLAQAASHVGMWDRDIARRLFHWSPELLNVFGLPADATAGFDAWMAAIHPDDQESAWLRIQAAIGNRTDLMSDHRIVLPGGEVRWVQATGKTHYADGQPSRMIGLCMDITDDIVLQTVAPEHRDQFAAAAGAAVQQDKHFEGDYRMIGLDAGGQLAQIIFAK